MKYASITLVVLGLFGFAFSACAEGDQPEFGNNTTGNGAGGNDGVGGGGGAGGGAVCAPTCASDSDCALTCAPAPTGSSNCCDKATSICFVSDQASCPVPPPPPDGGGTGGSGQMY